MNLNARRVAPFIGLLSLVLALAACVSSSDSVNDNAQVAAAVRAVLEAQQAAWNRGDIDGFMDGYERAETTMFVSGDELTKGWRTVLERYRRRYTSAEQMGTLAFSELDIEPLGPVYALADGRWRLTRTNDTPHGRFTLVFKKTPSGWRIVHDTTTSAME